MPASNPEVIDSLLVKLGLDTDTKGFKEADAMFRGVTSKALQFGAVIGAGLGIGDLTFGFANATEKLGRFADRMSTTPRFVDALGYAFEQVGGDSDEAFSSIEKVANLVENTDWGNIPSDAFRIAGFDPLMLQGVSSIAEAYERISKAVKELDPESQRRALKSLGFGGSEIDLFTGTGNEDLRALIDKGLSVSVVNENMTRQGKEFNKGISNLSKTVEGMSRETSSMFIDDLTGLIQDLNDFLRENNKAIIGFIKEAMPYLETIAVGIGALVAAQVGKKGLGLLLSPKKYAPVLAAAGLYQISKDDDVQEFISDPSFKNFNNIVGSLVSKLPNVDIGKLPPDIQERIRTNEPDRFEKYLEEMGDYNLNLAKGSGDVINNISVDARGATDPVEVERAAERGAEAALQKAVGNALNDVRSNLK